MSERVEFMEGARGELERIARLLGEHGVRTEMRASPTPRNPNA